MRQHTIIENCKEYARQIRQKKIGIMYAFLNNGRKIDKHFSIIGIYYWTHN